MDEPKQQELIITEDKYFVPLKKVLESSPSQSLVPTSLKKSLDELFPEQEYEEKAIKRAKEVLGGLVNEFSQDQIRDIVAEIQFLVTTWLDEFEKGIFDGLTLKELLHEKGSI